mgnify:CR=1 FL=1
MEVASVPIELMPVMSILAFSELVPVKYRLREGLTESYMF